MRRRTALTLGLVPVVSAIVVLTAYKLAQPTYSSFLDRLDGEVPALLDKRHEPGLAVAFVDGCKASIRTYGVANRERATPVRDDTVFNVGSVSKTFTAWAVMTLVEAGRVKLDDPIDRYLQRWHLPESSFDRAAVTVRRLLNHTAGISVPSVSGIDYGTTVPSLIDELNGRGPNPQVQILKQPGGSFEYSGGGYAILQLLVEDVTGQPLAEYAKAAIFDRLGMTSTSFGWTREAAQRAATPYLADGSAYRLREFSASGAAGLVTTVRDMATFAVAHCAGGNSGANNPVLKAATIEQLRSGSVEAPALGRGARYALGYNVFPGASPEHDIVGHGGSNLGWKAELLLMPSQGLGIVILTHAGDGKVRNDVKRMFRDEAASRTRS